MFLIRFPSVCLVCSFLVLCNSKCSDSNPINYLQFHLWHSNDIYYLLFYIQNCWVMGF